MRGHMRNQDDMNQEEWDEVIRAQPSSWLWRRLNGFGIYKNPDPAPTGMGRSALLIMFYCASLVGIFEWSNISSVCQLSSGSACALTWLLTGLCVVSVLALLQWFRSRYQ